MLRAITIRQPHAHLILTGEKLIEHRSWRTHHRGPLLIHAGKEIDEHALERLGLDRATLVRGAIIGVVDVVEVIRRGSRFDWRLANPRRFAEPIVCAGKQMLWTPPPAVMRAIEMSARRLRATA